LTKFVVFDTMVFLLLNFLVAFLGFTAFLVVLISIKGNENPTNYYFLIILFWLTIRRFLYSFIFLFEIEIPNTVKISSIEYLVVPLFYLFIKKFVHDKISLQENLFHLILATLFFLGHFFSEINGILKASLFFVFTTIYLFYMVKKIFVFIKETKNNRILKSKKNWLLIMFSLILCFYFIFSILLFNFTDNIAKVHRIFYNLSAIIWLIALTYLFVKPEILFGTKNLKNIIRKEELTIKNIWKSKPIKKIQDYNQKVHASVALNAIDIMCKVEDYVENYDFHNNASLDFKSLAFGIDIQAYHLNYIFKYYCIYSKSDFFNYCKVMYLLKLIEEGYLQNKTINSLINDSHFKSKQTFYNNFQKFTGKNPQEINRLLKFKM